MAPIDWEKRKKVAKVVEADAVQLQTDLASLKDKVDKKDASGLVSDAVVVIKKCAKIIDDASGLVSD